MASGVLQIQPFWDILGPKKAKSLSALHVFSGADNTGSFARMGNAKWFKIFLKAEDDTIEALRMVSDDSRVMEEQQKRLARFVCAAYCPKGIQIRNISELQWHIFCKYMSDSGTIYRGCLETAHWQSTCACSRLESGKHWAANTIESSAKWLLQGW